MNLFIDRTLISTWNWRPLGKTSYSGKHHHAGFNHQITYTLDGKLLAITDLLPGLGVMLTYFKTPVKSVVEFFNFG